jgi:PAS domain S-box-containing protein
MKTDEQLARERAGLEEQVHARTAELEREVQVRRQAEAAAQASEERYRLLAESGSEVVWAVDMACNVTYVSPSIENLRGYSRQETLHMTWEERLQTGFAPHILQVLRNALAALRTGQAIEHGPFIALQTHKNGSPIWTETVINELL